MEGYSGLGGFDLDDIDDETLALNMMHWPKEDRDYALIDRVMNGMNDYDSDDSDWCVSF